MKYKKERTWIRKKLYRENVSQKELLHTVGMFSNKNKKKVMAEKGISSAEYDKRYKFLANVHFLLSNEKF
jgi:hypothetical protein